MPVSPVIRSAGLTVVSLQGVQHNLLSMNCTTSVVVFSTTLHGRMREWLDQESASLQSLRRQDCTTFQVQFQFQDQDHPSHLPFHTVTKREMGCNGGTSASGTNASAHRARKYLCGLHSTVERHSFGDDLSRRVLCYRHSPAPASSSRNSSSTPTKD